MGKAAAEGSGLLRCGSAKAEITPAVGTRMLGFLERDESGGCREIRDPLFARAVWLEQDGETAVIVSLDLCLMSRELCDQVKGAIGRYWTLTPRQVLLNFTHTHSGPYTGMWRYGEYGAPDYEYLVLLQNAILSAVAAARAGVSPATLEGGCGRTRLPVNRRRVNAAGIAEWGPSPDGPVYDRLPVCLFRDGAGRPIVLLFSVACHPSIARDHSISAEYPGAAIRQIELGLDGGSAVFLQGCGADTKPFVVAGADAWSAGGEAEIREAGNVVAGEVRAVVEAGMERVSPALGCRLCEGRWRRQQPFDISVYRQIAADPSVAAARRRWAAGVKARLESGQAYADSFPVTLQGVQLGRGLRMIGLEGEPVAEIGRLVEDSWGSGLTFPLGFTNGVQHYLPVSRMIRERGYEIECYDEYSHPAPVADGIEARLASDLRGLRDLGIR